MPSTTPYEDAVELLDNDHRFVKQMFIDYGALCDDDAEPERRSALAANIVQSLEVHTELEEQIFYPAIAKLDGLKKVVEQAIADHAGVKARIAALRSADAVDRDFDLQVRQLGLDVDAHVLDERELIFPVVRRSSGVDLKQMAVPMFALQKKLKAAAPPPPRVDQEPQR